MSINVTVNGNPVSIKRGKMVTSDPNYVQKEQQKRRKMRLQQVRQQSKDIAESVRNKVRKERTKQLTNFEQENAAKLKEWQNRKLIDLQSQYRDCLKDIGMGHTQALIEENEETEFLEKKEKEFKGKARERGMVAKEKLQIEMNEKNLKAARPKQIKKMVRDVENVRSKMIADIAKNKNKIGDKEDDLLEVLSEDEVFETGQFVRNPENMHFPSPDVSGTSSPGMPRENFPVKADIEVYNTQFPNRLPKAQIKKNLNARKFTQSDDQFENSRQDKAYSKTPSDCRMECLKDFDKIKSPNRKRTKSPNLAPKNRKSPKKIQQDFSDENFEFHESIKEKSRKSFNDDFIESDENFDENNRSEKNRKFVPEFDSDFELPKNKSPKSKRFTKDQFSDVEVFERSPSRRKTKSPHSKRFTNPEYLDVEDYERSPNRKKSKSPKSKKFSTDEYLEDYQRSPSRRKTSSPQSSKSRRDNSDTSLMKKTLKFDEENQSISRATMTEDPPVNFPIDTRISDRIKNRRLPVITHETLITRESQDLKDSGCQTEIPTKPKISLKPSSSQSSQSFSKIKTYDHENRFSSDLIVDNNVQRISEESIEVCVDDNEDVSYNKMKFRREVEAEKRGRLALEKAKIQRDYEDLMQKLPVLQKQERLAAMDPSKDKFHLSDERKKEAEKSRQKKIENYYEGLINVITIPKKNPKGEEEELKKIDFVGSWREEANECKGQKEPKKTVDDFLGSWKKELNEPSESLQNLLEKLRIQKELLLKETEEPQPCQLAKTQSKDSTSTKTSTSSSDKPQFVSASTSPIKKHKDKKKLMMKSSPCKHRGRTRKDVLILQNMSTQTSPKTSVCQAPTKQECAKKETCNCADSSDKLCEILIKFQENEKPEVVVKSPEKMKETGVVIAVEDEEGKKMEKVLIVDSEKKGQGKKVGVQEREKVSPSAEKNALEEKKKSAKKIAIGSTKKGLDKTKLQSSGYDTSTAKSVRPKDSSWSQNFSKNDFTTSSTSYFSPPDYRQKDNLLKNPPKQTNLANKSIDPRLLTYIKKLLTMSRNNLDNLSVSAVSEVSTPSSSVMNSSSNNPTGKLLNVLKFFNLDLNDVMQNLSKSGNTSERTSSSGYNASHSGMNETNANVVPNLRKNHIDFSGSDQTDYISFKKDNLEKSKGQNSKLQEDSRKENQSADARSLNLDSYIETNYPDVLAAHYSNLADKCQQKISDITARLVKVREEKNELLSPNTSDKENATTYLNLPSHLGEDSSGKSISPDADQKELTKKLLTIDINSLSNKLIENSGPREFNTDIDKDIIERYLKLLDEQPTNEFVPLLLDIPKLPKLEEKDVQTKAVEGKTKRPPPTKSAVNNQLNFMPHELSTIVEGDNSMRKSKSPEKGGFIKLSITPAGEELRDLGDQRLEKSGVREGSVGKSKSPEKGGFIKLSITPAGEELRDLGVQRLERSSVEEASVGKSKSPEKGGFIKLSITPAGEEMRELGVERLEKTSVEELDLGKNVRVLQAEESDNRLLTGYLNRAGPGVKGNVVKEGMLVKKNNLTRGSSSDTSEDINAEMTPSSIDSSTVVAAKKITITPRLISPQPGPSNYNSCRTGSCTKKSPLQQIIQKLQEVSTDTSSDKSEVDIEAMLKNMGMGWAVATYRKTQEALAQESSTSSLDTSKKKNVSTSTSKSDNTISPFFRDFQDISAIQGSGVSNDRQHRTSTPVQSNRSSEKNSEESGKLFSGESDLSSVKGKRDSDIIFVSMPNVTGSSSSTT